MHCFPSNENFRYGNVNNGLLTIGNSYDVTLTIVLRIVQQLCISYACNGCQVDPEVLHVTMATKDFRVTSGLILLFFLLWGCYSIRSPFIRIHFDPYAAPLRYMRGVMDWNGKALRVRKKVLPVTRYRNALLVTQSEILILGLQMLQFSRFCLNGLEFHAESISWH